MLLTPSCPVRVDELLDIACQRGRVQHISLSVCADGSWQASVKQPGQPGYKVCIQKTPLGALEAALGPDYGHGWSEVLGDLDEAVALAVATRQILAAELIDEEDDFDPVGDLI